MTYDEPIQPTTPPSASALSFSDLPLSELLETNVADMTHDERVAFVAKLRSMRNAQHLKAAIAPRASSARPSKVPEGFDAQTMLDQLLKDL